MITDKGGIIMNYFNKLCVLVSLLFSFLMSSNISFAYVTPGAVIDKNGNWTSDPQCCIEGGELKVGAEVPVCDSDPVFTRVTFCNDGCKFKAHGSKLYAYNINDSVMWWSKVLWIKRNEEYGGGQWYCDYSNTCIAD